MTLKTFGITNPDERQVALIVWRRNEDGTPNIAVDDVNRKYVIVPEEENEAFEKAATAQGWQYSLAGFDDYLARRTYSLDKLPPEEFKALDLTKGKDVATLHNKIRFDKRFRTKALIQKAERAIDKALNIGIGEMGNDETAEGNRKIRGAELVDRLAKTIVQMESMNQTDEHQQEKNARLDAGLESENVGMHKTYRIDPETHDQV